jgi:hypothetical protein
MHALTMSRNGRLKPLGLTRWYNLYRKPQAQGITDEDVLSHLGREANAVNKDGKVVYHWTMKGDHTRLITTIW